MVSLLIGKKGNTRSLRRQAKDRISTFFERELFGTVFVLAILLWYLGVSPVSALLATSFWVAQGVTGAWIISRLSARISQKHELLFVLGPGALLGIAVTTSTYIIGQGGTFGATLSVGLILLGSIGWFRSRSTSAATQTRNGSSRTLLLTGCALLANSGEFPNLLMSSVAMIAIGLVSARRVTWPSRVVIAASAFGLLTYSELRRDAYWWWASDDTTMLSAIGTMVVRRGHIADTAGWPTESYHWFLHAWLALWNQLSSGQIFETYQVVWPVVAAVSVLASLWLIFSLSLGTAPAPFQFFCTAIAAAGLLRLEWPAPQEQQPFLFAMIAAGMWWLATRTASDMTSVLKSTTGLVVVGILIPLVLYFSKPSLIAAWGLLLAGAALEYARHRYRLNVLACVILAGAVVVAGVSMMRIGSSWVSGRYITSFGISYLSPDLGWCERGSFAHTVTCVLSLRVTLILAFLLAVAVLVFCKFPGRTKSYVVLLLPLVLAYLPFRLLVSSGVGSGAPSFYRLPEMGMMAMILLALATLLLTGTAKVSTYVLLSILAFVAVQLTAVWRAPSDALGPLLLRFTTSQYLYSRDVAVLAVCIGGALLLSGFVNRQGRLIGAVSAVFCVISVVPLANLTSEVAETENSTIRATRPEYLGPRDLDDVARWLGQYAPPDALIATNYLCDENRIDECRRSTPSTVCVSREPVLTASWALMALSEREFLYLSQGWEVRPSSFFLHEVSTRLSGDVSLSSVNALITRGVTIYVASREHSSPRSWQQFMANALFRSENFAIVSLERLRDTL